MAKIHKDLAKLVYRLRGTMTAQELSQALGRSYRDFGPRMEREEGFVLNDRFVDGLASLGYDLILEERECEKCKNRRICINLGVISETENASKGCKGYERKERWQMYDHL